MEGSVFNGREADEHRWNFDFASLDSVSGRIWFKPNSEWALQVSTGHLVHPEQLEAGNIERSTASATWTRTTPTSGAGASSVSFGYGRNDSDHGARQAVFVEGARYTGPNTFYGRLEVLQLETAPTGDPVSAFTLGGVRDMLKRRRFDGGFGAGVTFYATPAALRPAYGAHPVSFQIFFRLRPAVRLMNMPGMQ